MTTEENNDIKEIIEETPATTETEDVVTDDASPEELKSIEEDIDAAIAEPTDDQLDDIEAEADDTDDSDTTDDDADDEGADDTDDDASDDDLPDDLVERAIRAGVSMKEIKEYPTASLLESVVSRLEGTPNEEDSDEEGEHDDADGDDPFEALRLDPEEYDEGLVSQFDKMVDLLKTQSGQIKSMQEQQGTTRQADWFDGAVKGLDKSLTKAMEKEPGRRDALRQKFDFLKAANEAAGQEVSPEAVLNEAVQLAMGDLVTKAAVQKEAAKITKRVGQLTHRPGGQNGNKTKGKVDKLAEIAAETDAEIASMG